ncbi:MAG: 50S ribosomal protein L1 [Patescibacteria group bacterium]|nr:50S ribosomal protein L1 [Patescibacteria group bacterium]MBU2509461.1 50S ribosomal protein L1 [Patescibacteria group bacterium]
MSRSKRYTQLKALIDPKQLYSIEEAVDLVKKTATTKFVGSVEVHMHLGVDVKQSDQQIRTTLVMPHSIGKIKRVAAFVSSDKEKDAKEAGAEVIGSQDIIDDIVKTGKIDFDVAVATPDMMPKLAKIAKILGPRGLMPNPKTDTVGTNVKKMVEDLKRGKVAIKNDATGNIHQSIGKTSLSEAELIGNYSAVLETIRKVKPAKAKGTYIKKVVLTSSMGPAIHVEVKN